MPERLSLAPILRRVVWAVVILLAVSTSLVLLAGAMVSAQEASLLSPDVSLGQASPAVWLPLVAAGGGVTHYPNCRFGVGGNVEGYDVAALNIGWHLNFGTEMAPAHPNGAEYVQVIRLSPAFGGYVFAPPTSTLYAMLDQNPGSIWLVGNEPDSPWQDNLWPEVYARAYHHLYYLIKQRDPSARVGVAAIVQPTPLRFQYLDRVLKAYRQSYDEPLSTDLWNTHSYILREIDPLDPDAFDPVTNPDGYEVWGAYIPPGLTVTRGLLYNYSDMFQPAIFQQRLMDFRRWMYERGYRETPLYITEYGTLFPYPPYIEPPPYVDENGVYMTEERTAVFMTSTFDILLHLSDPVIGYPADENRLVQRWVWYSVSHTGYGGLLFDPDTRARRPLGDVFYTYTHAIPPAVDLLAVRVTAGPVFYTGQPQTATLQAMVSNVGNMAISAPITVAFYSGQPLAGTLIGIKVITSTVKGCADETLHVSMTWPNLDAGRHPVYVQVDPDHAIAEANESNNTAVGWVLVATHRFFLPIVLKVHPVP